MKNESTIIKFVLGFVLGIIIASLNSCDVRTVNINKINDAMKMCEGKEVNRVDVGTPLGCFYHANTTLYCKDKSIIKINPLLSGVAL